MVPATQEAGNKELPEQETKQSHYIPKTSTSALIS